MSNKIPNRQTLAFYRRLLHTMMESFSGDFKMFHQCRIEARKKILEHKDETDPIKIQDHIFFGEEVRDFLKTNIIQGNMQQSGKYRFKARKEHAMGNTVKPLPTETKNEKK